MTVRIENHSQKKIFLFNLEKKINRLIDIIPKDHIIGLEKIVIVDEIKNKKVRNAAGIYKKKHGLEPAYIEISVEAVYKKMPKILFYLPFIAKFTLADVLYHEIGHHYHYKYKHGVNKRRKESFAENYRKDMLKKAFWIWLIFLKPISPLIRYLSKTVNN
jgi:hypothetical protein